MACTICGGVREDAKGRRNAKKIHLSDAHRKTTRAGKPSVAHLGSWHAIAMEYHRGDAEMFSILRLSGLSSGEMSTSNPGDHPDNHPDNDPGTIGRNARNGMILFVVYVVLYVGFMLLNAF